MLIPIEIIVGISLPFVVGQAALYQILFDALFIRRFVTFSKAASKEVDKQFDVFVEDMTELKTTKATIEDKIEKIEEKTEILYIVQNFRDEFDKVVKNSKWIYLSFIVALLASIGSFVDLERIQIYNFLGPSCLILGVASSFYLGWKLFDLNSILVKFEIGEPINKITEQLKERE